MTTPFSEEPPAQNGPGAHGHDLPQPKSPREALQPEDVPPPPKASSRARHPWLVFFNGMFSMALLAVIALGVVLIIGQHQFASPGPLQEERTMLITRGMDTRTIAAQLQRNGVIDNEHLFLAGLFAYRVHGDLKAGEYIIPAHASMAEVMSILVEGRAVLHSVTIPEGWTSAQIVAHLNAQELLVGEITDVPEEGTLLPETYKFTRGTNRNEVLRRMRRERDRVLEEVWSRRAEGLPVSTPEELVTLASIVEKETGRADERTRVAAVFVNRLNQGMRLQSDPTIIYGLYGGDAWTEARSITRAELDAPNAYSTYQIFGLPPGPIANPGRASLEAVANPSRTGDLFFVADGTGGHAFAETLEEHNRNVARWRRIEEQRRQAAPATGQ
ncbi:MAG: endolytic transglycosylase MltG [Hyphomicrobiaceae bacterium]|nr:endolytic transglycosylase MltG [Hyphomicrobiaceae bacterium]